MKPIPGTLVDEIWSELESMAPEGAQELMERMTDQQPFLLAYLMAIEGDNFNDEERGLLIYLGMVIWMSLSKGDRPLREVSEEDIDAAEAANLKMLEYLEGEPEGDFVKTVETITNNFNQFEIFRSILEALIESAVEEKGDGGGFREANTGLAMIHLKTVIDLLDQ